MEYGVRRSPRSALVSGILATGTGAALLLSSNEVAGLFWYAVPISLLGLALVGIWVRATLRVRR